MASSTHLEHLVSQLLQEVGVLKTSASSKNRGDNDSNSGGSNDNTLVFRRMEQWLGIVNTTTTAMMMTTTTDNDEDDDDMEGLTVEDCAPFSSQVYEQIAAIFVHAWDPTSSSNATGSSNPNMIFTTNLFIEELRRLQRQQQAQAAAQQQADHRVPIKEDDLVEAYNSLDCIPAIRVTTWLRHLMECNVQGSSSHSNCMEEGEASQPSVRTFAEYLLKGHLESKKDTTTAPSYATNLLQALFTHMTWLPTYQSQLLLFIQAFQRGDLVTNTTADANANKNVLSSGTKIRQAIAVKSASSSSPKATASTTTTTMALQDPTHRLHHYKLAQILSQRLTQQFAQHVRHCECILGEFYAVATPSQRQLCRAGLARIWTKFVLTNASNSGNSGGGGMGRASLRGENTTASGLDASLRVLYRILLGMKDLPQESDSNSQQQQHQVLQVLEELLFHHLLPLHQPNAMVLWRDQTSLLELYHEPLVQCIAHIFKIHPQWIAPVCQALLMPSEPIWPVGGNTPKQVLLLHEVDMFLGMLISMDNKRTGKDDDPQQHEPSEAKAIILEESAFIPILSTLAQCMASEHSRLAERALTFFRNAYFKQMVYEDHYQASLRVLLPTLTRSNRATAVAAADGCGAPKHSIPWNPTVRKMTFHVLKNLQQHDSQVFATVCNQVFGDAPIPPPRQQEQEQPPVQKSSLLAPKPQESSPSSIPAFNQRFSLQAGMGNWRPPPSAKQQQRQRGNSSSSDTSGSHFNMPPPSARPPSKPPVNQKQQPPLGVTGIAPWAVGANSNSGTKRVNPPSTITGVAPWAMGGAVGSITAKSSNHKLLPPMASKNPPLTVTGVAPWASSAAPPSGLGNLSQKRPGAPPIAAGMPPHHKRPPQSTGPKTISPRSSSLSESPAEESNQGTSVLPQHHAAKIPQPPAVAIAEEDENKDDEEETEGDAKDNTKDNPGLAHVLYYMEQCKPPGMDDDEDEHASSSWSKAQMSETPTLLPDLKFHDLVFGQELGQGAFGVVRYARLIDRTKTRSQWPEYAVKVIATEKMKEMGYEYSVAREIACLHLVSHPNVARLVSSFRFQQGAYLVLEYASGGDLHQLLQQHGSLDVPSCQFVLGEIVAALASLHDDLGFVYSDLKPENIVISETGHVKLTDFGACRPYTEQAKAMLKAQMGKSHTNLLEALREGDPRKYNKNNPAQLDEVFEEKEDDDESASGWMSTDEDSKKDGDTNSRLIDDDTFQVVESKDEEDGEKEDMRIEGTTAYLPPEVVLGSIPTPAADSWALGCVLYQCLSGRPPMMEADDALTRHRIVTFENTSDGVSMVESENDPLFGPEQKHAADVSDTAKALVRALLNRLPSKRPSMQQVAHHDFFDGQDVMSLYQKPPYPLDVGGVAPGPPDAQWSRRQFSSIWAPQPQAYDISGVGATSTAGQSLGSASTAPISESDGEVGAPFSVSNFYRVAISRTRDGANDDNNNAESHQPPVHSSNDAMTADLAHQPLANIEEDDVSMASSNEGQAQAE